MTNKDAFRFGYYAALADRGVSPLVTKAASIRPGSMSKMAFLESVGPMALGALTLLGVTVPTVLGTTTGKMHAELLNSDDVDVEETRDLDLTQQFRLEAQRVRERRNLNRWRNLTSKQPSSLGSR